MKLSRSIEQRFFMGTIVWAFIIFSICVVSGKLLDIPPLVSIGPLFLVIAVLATIGLMGTIFEPGEQK